MTGIHCRCMVRLKGVPCSWPECAPRLERWEAYERERAEQDLERIKLEIAIAAAEDAGRKDEKRRRKGKQ
jgi:hypothetical protein